MRKEGLSSDTFKLSFEKRSPGSMKKTEVTIPTLLIFFNMFFNHKSFLFSKGVCFHLVLRLGTIYDCLDTSKKMCGKIILKRPVSKILLEHDYLFKCLTYKDTCSTKCLSNDVRSQPSDN